MRPARVVSTLFLCVGILSIAVGVFMIQHTRNFLARAVTAPGIVVENVWKVSRSTDDEASGAYYPRVRFRMPSGEQREFLSSTGTSPASYGPSEPVTVLFDPRNPDDAAISGFWSLWLGVVIVLGLGGIFTLIGVVTQVITRPALGPLPSVAARFSGGI